MLGDLKAFGFVIFEYFHISIRRVVLKDIGSFREFHYEINSIRTIANTPIHNTFSLGYFDVASQENGSKCGVGVVLKLRENHIFCLKMSCGRGSNTHGELLGIWSMLYFARTKLLSNLLLLADSNMIIDWLSNKCRL